MRVRRQAHRRVFHGCMGRHTGVKERGVRPFMEGPGTERVM